MFHASQITETALSNRRTEGERSEDSAQLAARRLTIRREGSELTVARTIDLLYAVTSSGWGREVEIGGEDAEDAVPVLASASCPRTHR